MTISKEKMIQMYATMYRIRQFETKVAEFFAAGKIPGFVHLCVGQEAVAAGTCSVLRKDDYITATHRGHGQMISKGGDVKVMMAEIFGKINGYCKGKGGSMHIADVDLGILGANGIVGGGGPLAVGAGLSIQYKGGDQVVACFFGDGASNEGAMQEAMNLASVWRLPVVFVNENNGYGISCHTSRSMAITDIADRAASFDMPGVIVDGNDVIAVHEAVSAAVKRARKGDGPSLIECKTYRWRGHFEGDACVYRTQEEVDEWMKKDPIAGFSKKLLKDKLITKKALDKMHAEIETELTEAVAFAEESPLPEPADILTDVYA